MDWNSYKSIDNGAKVEITYPNGTKEIKNVNYDEYTEKTLTDLVSKTKRK